MSKNIFMIVETIWIIMIIFLVWCNSKSYTNHYVTAKSMIIIIAEDENVSQHQSAQFIFQFSFRV